jgi:O-antigen ligase
VAGALLLAVASVVALVGIVAAIVQSDPLALDICGSWRPAGPFEYPPTLGLVCVGALPVALALGGERRRTGAALAWLLALTVALTANRTAIAFAGAALVATVWLAPRGRELGPLALAVVASATASALVIGSHLGDAGAGRLLVAIAFLVLPVAAASRAWAGRRGTWVGLVVLAALAATAGGTIADKGSGCQGDASHGRVGIWRAAVATARERPLQGFGSGTFLSASREHQLAERPRVTRFAHNQVLESWVELGLVGAALVIAWLIATLALAWRARRQPDAYLLIPFVVAFPLANLLDWPWHLLGAGVLWAVATGALFRES